MDLVREKKGKHKEKHFPFYGFRKEHSAEIMKEKKYSGTLESLNFVTHYPPFFRGHNNIWKFQTFNLIQTWRKTQGKLFSFPCSFPSMNLQTKQNLIDKTCKKNIIQRSNILYLWVVILVIIRKIKPEVPLSNSVDRLCSFRVQAWLGPPTRP